MRWPGPGLGRAEGGRGGEALRLEAAISQPLKGHGQGQGNPSEWVCLRQVNHDLTSTPFLHCISAALSPSPSPTPSSVRSAVSVSGYVSACLCRSTRVSPQTARQFCYF